MYYENIGETIHLQIVLIRLRAYFSKTPEKIYTIDSWVNMFEQIYLLNLLKDIKRILPE